MALGRINPNAESEWRNTFTPILSVLTIAIHVGSHSPGRIAKELAVILAEKRLDRVPMIAQAK